MNAAEFNRWWADVKLCFPSIGAWLVKTFPDKTQQADVLRKWAGVLSDVGIDHALEINRAMQLGDLPFVGEYDGDKERLPQHVRRLAKQLSWERRERVQELVESKPSSFPAGKILRRMAELARLGFNREDAMAQALKDFPIGPPSREPRYNCRLCLDVGSILVAPHWAVTAMLDDRFEKCRHRNSSARCKCQKPLPLNSRWQQATYDAARHFRIDDPLWPDSQVSDFRAWCEMKREEFWNSKRETAFDSFNNR